MLKHRKNKKNLSSPRPNFAPRFRFRPQKWVVSYWFIELFEKYTGEPSHSGEQHSAGSRRSPYRRDPSRAGRALGDTEAVA